MLILTDKEGKNTYYLWADLVPKPIKAKIKIKININTYDSPEIVKNKLLSKLAKNE